MSVKIAIVDSGVNPAHPHVREVADGVGFELDSHNRVQLRPDFSDGLGHGTAIAGVIREINPKAEFYALKIFHSVLGSPFILLKAALEWAALSGVHLIHLSLGTHRESFRDELQHICGMASASGAFIISAARSPDDWVYPSVFPNVIGVYWDRACGESDLVYHPGAAIQFGAHGRPRPLPGLSQERNFQGGSFAAARVTARAARILAKRGRDMSMDDLVGMLAAEARRDESIDGY